MNHAVKSKGLGFKVWVKTFGDDQFYTNAKVFDTKEEAEEWGQGLLGRWMAAEAVDVREQVT